MRAAGRAGEDAACAFLIENGYGVLYRNFRFGRYGEIDIIAQKAGVICFIEVKSRAGDNYGAPSEAVGHSKRKNIITVAKHFVRTSGAENQTLRFDVIEIYLRAGAAGKSPVINKIRHIENAFGDGYV